MLSLLGCDSVSRDEVAVAESPNHAFEAVLVEINGGATVDFAYEVGVRPRGSHAFQSVAFLYGATRSQCAYGVNLRWRGKDTLQIEYLEAKFVKDIKSHVTLDSRPIKIVLENGVSDPNAPGGGMLYNLEKQSRH